MVDISVVIAVCPAHHRDSLLGRCLRGVAEQTFGRNRCEVILVGDGVELDPSLVPPGLSARCYSFPSPVGLTRVRNQCLRLASAELVAFLDADAVPHPDWLLCLHDRLTEEGAAACGGATRPTLDPGEHENRISSSRYVLPCAGMNNVLFRKAVLEEVGGWDEALGFGAEEPDLCWRVCLKGHRFAHAADAIVAHRTEVSMRKLRHYGRSLRHLERKFGAVLVISRRAELRMLADAYRRLVGRGELSALQLLAVAWGYGSAWLAEVVGRPPRLRPVDLTERTLQAQQAVPVLAVTVGGRPLVRPNHVLWWTSDRGCSVVNLASRTRVELEGVAGDIWTGLMRGETLAHVRAQLEGEYDVAAETLAADIDELLRALLGDGMLRAADAA
jgi:hypothetical protein